MRTLLKYTLCLSALLAFGIGELNAQHYFGIRGGYGSGSARLYPERDFENGTVWGLYSGGVSWKYYAPEPFVGGIEVDAIIMQQGYKTLTKDYFSGEPQSGYERYVNTFMVPIFWQPHVYMFRQRLRVFLNAGVTFSYVMSSTEKHIKYLTDSQEVTENDYNMRLTRDNRFGYGLCGGGGISWAAGRLELFVEARYYIGYSDLLKNWNKNEGNEHLRSPLDGLQVSAGMFWRVGKDGIRSTQGRGLSAKQIREMTKPLDEGVTEAEEVETETTPGEVEEIAVEADDAGDVSAEETSVGEETDDTTEDTAAVEEQDGETERKTTRKERRRESKKTE